MAAEYTTCEAKAFCTHYDQLLQLIQEPDLPGLGGSFFSHQFISQQVLENVGKPITPKATKTTELLLAVLAHLEVHPDKFQTVLDIFNREPPYRRVSNDMKKTHRTFKAVTYFLIACTDPTMLYAYSILCW